MAKTYGNRDRAANIGFAVFYGFFTLVLSMIGFMIHPVVFFLLAAVSLGIALKLFFTRKDVVAHF